MHVHLSICVFVHPYVCASLYLVLAVAFSLPKASLTYILVSWLRRCLVGRRKQSLEHSAFFFHLCLYFKAFSKLFISPWCCRKEVIRDAKQKVTHIPPLPVFYFLKPFFFLVFPPALWRRKMKYSPIHVQRTVKLRAMPVSRILIFFS